MEVLWAMSSIFRKKPRVYREKIDYDFIDIEDTDASAIVLHVENYEDVMYQYHQARVVEEGVLAKLQFGYTIINSGKHDIDVLNSDENFHTIMGDILTTLLMSNINDSIRADNSEKLDLQ
jgi:hypothetical protein